MKWFYVSLPIAASVILAAYILRPAAASLGTFVQIPRLAIFKRFATWSQVIYLTAAFASPVE